MSVERLYSAPEIAERWGCKNDTVYSHIRAGNLRAFDVSLGVRPRWRILASDLDTFELARESSAWNSPPRPKRRTREANVMDFFP